MGLKDILTVVTSEAAGEGAIRVAEQLAMQADAKLSVQVVGWRPPVPISSEIWVDDPVYADMLARAQAQLDSDSARVALRLNRDRDGCAVESLLVEFGSGRAAVGIRAMHADLAVVAKPAGPDAAGDRIIFEGALFGSGRPVVVAPPDWKPRAIGQSVLVCWKPTREAARALGDAELVLQPSARIAVVTVDAQPSEKGYGPAPGADIANHLARRGHQTTLENLVSAGRTEAETILDHAVDMDADLIIMGGYGHSRLSETIFGGVTRDILFLAAIPVLMSH